MNNSQNSLVFTSSQERMVDEVLPHIIMDNFFPNGSFEAIETKYDISQELMMQQQQELVMPLQPSQILTTDEFPGDYNFQLIPDQQEDAKSWVYSQKLKKVFIEMEKTLPTRVSLQNWNPLQGGLCVRAIMAYCQPTHRSEVVTRCHNHVALSNPSSPYIQHVLSCKNPQAMYSKVIGHYSVVVPLGTPQAGSNSVQMDFTFHCKNSCSTGINRRPTEIVFSLENAVGEVLGRRKLPVRICSCPRRDRDKEERCLREQSAPKKRKLAPGKKLAAPVYREHQPVEPDSEVYNFSVRVYGRENFETLKKVAYGLNAASIQQTGLEAVIRPLLDDINRM